MHLKARRPSIILLDFRCYAMGLKSKAKYTWVWPDGRLLPELGPTPFPASEHVRTPPPPPAKPQMSSVMELQESVLVLNKRCNTPPYS